MSVVSGMWCIVALSVLATILQPHPFAQGTATSSQDSEQAPQTPPWQDLLVLTCGQPNRPAELHLFPQHPLIHTGIKVDWIKRLVQAVSRTAIEDARCHCPQLSNESLRANFEPSFVNILKAIDKPRPPVVDDYKQCNFSMSMKMLNQFSNITLPGECSSANFTAGRPCVFEWRPLNFIQNTKFQFAWKSCSGDPAELPYLSLSCSGSFCNDLLRPCQKDSDCALGSAGACQSLNLTDDVDNALYGFLMMGQWAASAENGTRATCFGVPGSLDFVDYATRIGAYVSRQAFGYLAGKLGISSWNPFANIPLSICWKNETLKYFKETSDTEEDGQQNLVQRMRELQPLVTQAATELATPSSALDTLASLQRDSEPRSAVAQLWERAKTKVSAWLKPNHAPAAETLLETQTRRAQVVELSAPDALQQEQTRVKEHRLRQRRLALQSESGAKAGATVTAEGDIESFLNGEFVVFNDTLQWMHLAAWNGVLDGGDYVASEARLGGSAFPQVGALKVGVSADKSVVNILTTDCDGGLTLFPDASFKSLKFRIPRVYALWSHLVGNVAVPLADCRKNDTRYPSGYFAAHTNQFNWRFNPATLEFWMSMVSDLKGLGLDRGPQVDNNNQDTSSFFPSLGITANLPRGCSFGRYSAYGHCELRYNEKIPIFFKSFSAQKPKLDLALSLHINKCYNSPYSPPRIDVGCVGVDCHSLLEPYVAYPSIFCRNDSDCAQNSQRTGAEAKCWLLDSDFMSPLGSLLWDGGDWQHGGPCNNALYYSTGRNPRAPGYNPYLSSWNTARFEAAVVGASMEFNCFWHPPCASLSQWQARFTWTQPFDGVSGTIGLRLNPYMDVTGNVEDGGNWNMGDVVYWLFQTHMNSLIEKGSVPAQQMQKSMQLQPTARLQQLKANVQGQQALASEQRPSRETTELANMLFSQYTGFDELPEWVQGFDGHNECNQNDRLPYCANVDRFGYDCQDICASNARGNAMLLSWANYVLTGGPAAPYKNSSDRIGVCQPLLFNVQLPEDLNVSDFLRAVPQGSPPPSLLEASDATFSVAASVPALEDALAQSLTEVSSTESTEASGGWLQSLWGWFAWWSKDPATSIAPATNAPLLPATDDQPPASATLLETSSSSSRDHAHTHAHAAHARGEARRHFEELDQQQRALQTQATLHTTQSAQLLLALLMEDEVSTRGGLRMREEFNGSFEAVGLNGTDYPCAANFTEHTDPLGNDTFACDCWPGYVDVNQDLDCHPVPCVVPANLGTGVVNVSCSGANILPNTTCELGCASGYMIFSGSTHAYSIAVDVGVVHFDYGLTCQPAVCAVPPANPVHGSYVCGQVAHGERCHLQCQDGYTNSTLDPVCQYGNYLGSPVCLPSSCGSLVNATLGRGRTAGDCIQRVTGELCTVECLPFHNPPAGGVVRCQANPGQPTSSYNAADIAAIVCTQFPCVAGPIPPFAGSYPGCVSNVPSGTTCALSCLPGYSRMGSDPTCYLGSYNGSTNVCQPAQCAPLAVHGLESNCSTGFTADFCTVRCPLDHIRTDGSGTALATTAECRGTGPGTSAWWYPTFTCGQRPCVSLPNAVVGGKYWTCLSTPIVSGTTCSLTCSDGFSKSGNDVTCYLGSYNGTASCDASLCPALSVTGVQSDCGNQPTGSLCTVSCAGGYERTDGGGPIGSTTTGNCTGVAPGSSIWRYSTFVCSPSPCRSNLPAVPVGGFYTGLCANPSSIPHGTQCALQCRAGYQRTGWDPLCQFGAFNASAPGCAPAVCPPIVNNALAHNCTASPTGSTCVIQCLPRHYRSDAGLGGAVIPAVCTGASDTSSTWQYDFGFACTQNPCTDTPVAPIGGNFGSCPSGSPVTSGTTCVLTCRAGYSKSGFDPTCYLGSLNYSSVLNSTCVPATCAPVSIANSLHNCTAQPTGSGCVIGCRAGYHRVDAASPAAVNGVCTGSGPASSSWAYPFAFSCGPDACPSVPVPPTGGSYPSCPGSVASGATCELMCANGYTKVGTDPTCVEGAFTNTGLNNCEVAQCAPLQPIGYDSTCLTAPTESTCSLGCAAGWQRTNGVGALTTSVTCRGTGVGTSVWTPDAPLVCGRMPCTVPASLGTGVVNVTCRNLRTDDWCELGCGSGYALADGIVDARCTAVSPGAVQFVYNISCIPAPCSSAPPNPPHGRYLSDCSGSVDGSVCHLTCDDGYGNTTTDPHCAYGSWVNVPSCYPWNCGTVSGLSAGRVAGSCVDVYTGDSCALGCMQNYTHVAGFGGVGCDADAGRPTASYNASELAQFVCAPNPCPTAAALVPPYGGSYPSCPSANVVHGTTCPLVCAPGYAKVGTDPQCWLGGFSYFSNDCQPARCSPLDLAPNITTTCGAATTEATCAVTCTYGYRRNDGGSEASVQATCTGIGANLSEWRYPTFTCQPLPCANGPVAPVGGVYASCPPASPVNSGRLCTLSCGPGYTHFGTDPTCVLGNYTTQARGCTPAYCTQLSLTGINHNCTNAPTASSCVMNCTVGWHRNDGGLEPSVVGVCTGNGVGISSWQYDTFTCEANPCPSSPAAPAGGSFPSCASNVPHNTLCPLVCADGWSKAAGIDPRCLLGVYVGGTTCVSAQCPPIVNDTLAHNCTAASTGSVCTLRCANGYERTNGPVNSNMTALCTGQGVGLSRWVLASLFICAASPCVTPPSAPAHGLFPTCTAPVPHGTVCALACDDGYLTAGGANPECSYGSFNNVGANSCDAAECAGLGAVGTGVIHNCVAGPTGSTCTLTCGNGYRRRDIATNDTAVGVCVGTGPGMSAWQISITCEEAPCVSAPGGVPQGGSYPSCASGNVTSGTTCVLSCVNGYGKTGSDPQCVRGVYENVNANNCQPATCAALSLPGVSSCSAATTGATCTMSCLDGYQPSDGSPLGTTAQASCLGSGPASSDWTYSFACSPQPCATPPTSPVGGSYSCGPNLPSGQLCPLLCVDGYGHVNTDPRCVRGAYVTDDGQPFASCAPAQCDALTALPAGATSNCGAAPTGSQCVVWCGGGYTPANSSASCAGTAPNLSQWSYAAITCAPLPCATLPAPPTGGSYGCPATNVVSGTTCPLSCAQGYTHTGTTELVCLLGGFLNSDVTCEAAQCAPVTDPVVDASSCSATATTGNTCNVRCASGYHSAAGGVGNTGQTVATCTGTGANPGVSVWRYTLACEEDPCATMALAPVAAGGAYQSPCSSVSAGTSVPSGTTCPFTCFNGYTKQGTDPQCVRGAFTAYTHQCVPALCPAIDEEGAVSDDCVDQPTGSNCTLGCQPGWHVIFGGPKNATTATCVGVDVGVSRWQHPQFICSADRCGPVTPAAPLGGTYLPCTTNITSGRVCPLRCFNGYQKVGGDPQCVSGQWAPHSANCVPASCGALNLPGANATCTGTVTGATCVLRCANGFYRSGGPLGSNGTATCRGVAPGTSQWQYSFTCKPIMDIIEVGCGERLVDHREFFQESTENPTPPPVFIRCINRQHPGQLCPQAMAWGQSWYTFDSDYCTTAEQATGASLSVCVVELSYQNLVKTADRLRVFPAGSNYGMRTLSWPKGYPIAYRVIPLQQFFSFRAGRSPQTPLVLSENGKLLSFYAYPLDPGFEAVLFAELSSIDQRQVRQLSRQRTDDQFQLGPVELGGNGAMLELSSRSMVDSAYSPEEEAEEDDVSATSIANTPTPHPLEEP